MEVFLHFDGLAAGWSTWFNNRRGAAVRINPGDWVIVDTIANPAWKDWIERGNATQVDRIPDGVDFLYENSDPKPPNIPAPWGDGEPPRGTFALCGSNTDPERLILEDGSTCTAFDLDPAVLEQIRKHFMPRELPGIALVDARRDKRGGRPAHTLPPPFELNFFIFIRLAWLICRVAVEAEFQKAEQDWAAYQEEVQDLDLPEDPVRRRRRGEVRRKVENAASELLSEWGVLRGDRLPNRVTIYRDMRSALLTVDGIDRVILGQWKELVDSGELPRQLRPQGCPPEAQ
jgi:hypothetical protein